MTTPTTYMELLNYLSEFRLSDPLPVEVFDAEDRIADAYDELSRAAEEALPTLEATSDEVGGYEPPQLPEVIAAALRADKAVLAAISGADESVARWFSERRGKVLVGIDLALDEGITTLRGADRRRAEGQEGRADLRRRLVEAHDAATVKPPPDATRPPPKITEVKALAGEISKAASGRGHHAERLRKAIIRLAVEVPRLLAEHTAALAARGVVVDELPDVTPEQLAQEVPAPELYLVLAMLPANWRDPALEAAVEATYLWPTILDAWRRDYQPVMFQAPGSLVMGAGGIGKLMGRGHADHAKELRKVRGQVEKVTLRSGKAQLDLLVPPAKTLAAPTNDEVLQAIAGMVTNAEFRFIMAAISQTNEEGRFLYSPTLFADLFDLPRGKTGDFDTKTRNRMDELRDNAGRMRLTTTVKVRGKSVSLAGDDLFAYDGAQVVEGQGGKAKKKGRRRLEVWRWNVTVLDVIRHGWPFPVPLHALRQPEGVRQDVWDDAFKVYCVLGAKARAEAKNAHHDATHPWTIRASTLLSTANVAGDRVRERDARDRLVDKILPLLNERGLVTYAVEAAGDGRSRDVEISFDLPPTRPVLASIPGRRKALPGRAK